ncbi:ABC transporter substrate-binding protein [Nesterenkonia massiliensis]|uniref:ABC transporter substrate-binding protein n=1 Tax=Nesterenkonia massiliensis TaxID=1232429 RepID=A0ABT2HNV3_9MICC|nr:ABC transporter substrate-binding protein [Nesterenkonia massiliensis]MCT1606370.1 ABC transporter substrate-binding protein [Nesterenkonia massiliensis]
MTERIVDPALKRRSRTYAAVGAALAVVLAVTAFLLLRPGTEQGPAAASAPGTGAEGSGGTLVYLDAEIIAAGDIRNGTWQSTTLTHNITDRLIHADPETGELEPWIAEDWEISEGGLQYTFWIRDGVSFSNGQPLDAGAVQRNLQWQAWGDPENGIDPNNTFPQVESVEADEEDQTVTVVLEEPYSPFIKILSNWASSLVADETLELSAEDQQRPENVIGSGPFVVESETYGEEIILTRRKGYSWAPASWENQGEAHLEEIHWIPVLEDSARLGSLRAGEGDLIRYLQPSEEDPLAAEGFEVIGVQGSGQTNTWVLRQSVEELQDERVRHAILSGIDREAIVEDLYTDRWSTASSIVTPDTLGYRDQSEKLTYDPERAQRLLDEAGWSEHDDDGIRVNEDGDRLTIRALIDVFDATAAPLFQLIQWQLAEIGVELELVEVDYSNVSTGYSDESIGIVRTGWPQADSWVRIRNDWHFEGSNALFLQEPDEQLNELLEQHSLVQGSEREEVVGDLQDHLLDNAYVFPVLTDSQIFALQPHVRGLSWTPEARPVFHSTWIAED